MAITDIESFGQFFDRFFFCIFFFFDFFGILLSFYGIFLDRASSIAGSVWIWNI